MVVSDAHEVLGKLTHAVDQGDTAATAVTAHQLKGMLSTFETDSPVIELQELIETARRGDHASMQQQFRLLEPRLTDLLDEISALQEYA